MAEQKKPFRMPAYLDDKQIADIKAEIKDIKDMRDSADENRRGDVGYFQHSGKHIVDPADVQKAIVARETQLRKLTPQKLTGEKANKALAYAKKLREWIVTNMPRETYALYPREKDPGTKASDFQKVVDAKVKWDGVRLPNYNVHPIAFYHYLMRRIDPNAPREDFNRYVRERA